jgi:hypothetical protein
MSPLHLSYLPIDLPHISCVDGGQMLDAHDLARVEIPHAHWAGEDLGRYRGDTGRYRGDIEEIYRRHRGDIEEI